MSDPKLRFFTGGTIPPGEGVYIPRRADDELFGICCRGEFGYVLASRQSGKSSLVVATAERLKQANYISVIIDVTEAGTGDVTLEKWYYWVIREIAETLNLDFDLPSWWAENSAIPMAARFQDFLEHVVLVQIQTPIIIFIDEIDAVKNFAFRDDFFTLLRAIYNQRAKNSLYKRLTFILIGTATPDELISDEGRTPFNIAQAVEMQDFQANECDLFREIIKTKHPQWGETYFDQIYAWTNGHPFLTHKLCQEVTDQAAQGQPDLVNMLVDDLFMTHARADNIKFVEKAILQHESAQEMLALYQKIWENNGTLPDDETSMARKLKLYGLVVSLQGKLRVRNQIYYDIFTNVWAFNHLRGEHRRIAELEAQLREVEVEKEKLQRKNYKFLVMGVFILLLMTVACFAGYISFP